MKNGFKFLCLIFVGLMMSASVEAAADMGKVTHNKLKSFTGYFEPYLKHDPPHYPNEERENKIVFEARDIFNWLNRTALWPEQEKITGMMKIDAARLFLYLGRAGIPEASKKTEDFALRGMEEAQDSYEVQIGGSRVSIEHGGILSLEGAVAAERALTLDRVRAESENANYYAAVGFYHAGHFGQGYEHLKKQIEIDASFENAEDLMFVFKSRVERWGYVPENVIFKENDWGDRIPVPSKKTVL